jgi:glucose-1-phosphate thymidylyltransferase
VIERGIVLAGGTGSRMWPATLAVSKQLIPIYDKPMVYYPLSVLMLARLKKVLVITTPHDRPAFERLLSDGSQWGMDISFAEQPSPGGLAQAFLIGEPFLEGRGGALILGDNIFYGMGLSGMLREAAALEEGAHVFAYPVENPSEYGVVELDAAGRALSIQEKPAKLAVSAFGRGFAWLDTGTHHSMLQASTFVEAIQQRQGFLISCPEELAFRNGWIDASALRRLAEPMAKNGYGQYLLRLADDGFAPD